MARRDLLHNELAEQIAEDCVCSCCGRAVTDRLVDHLGHRIYSGIKQAVEVTAEQGEEDEKKKRHDELFGALFKAIAPYERKFANMLRGIWEEERRIILANLKKIKKSWLGKAGPEDIVDSILYPKTEFVKKIINETNEVFEVAMAAEGHRVSEAYGLGIAFNVENPNVQKWLKGYVMKFAKKLEKTSQKKLKNILLKGLKEGSSIPEIMKMIQDEFRGWSKFRAEKVSRSEILRASNAGAKGTYLQAGVKKLQWLAYIDKRTCFFCEDLNGKIVGVEENFLDLGDKFTVEREGVSHTLDVSYTDVEYPPAHSLCRCTITPVIS